MLDVELIENELSFRCGSNTGPDARQGTPAIATEK
jgi:hypothetical protein